jgi:hypothetical protein
MFKQSAGRELFLAMKDALNQRTVGRMADFPD